MPGECQGEDRYGGYQEEADPRIAEGALHRPQPIASWRATPSSVGHRRSPRRCASGTDYRPEDPDTPSSGRSSIRRSSENLHGHRQSAHRTNRRPGQMLDRIGQPSMKRHSARPEVPHEGATCRSEDPGDLGAPPGGSAQWCIESVLELVRPQRTRARSVGPSGR
jgi:hypothetical protein